MKKNEKEEIKNEKTEQPIEEKAEIEKSDKKQEILEETSTENIEVLKEEKKDDVKEQNKNTENNKELEKEAHLNREKGKHQNKKKNSIKIAICIILLIIGLLVFSTIFAIMNIVNSNVIKGVYIENIDLSNLTNNEVRNIVSERITNIEDIELVYKDYSTIVKLEELGLEIDAEDAINSALTLGKTENIIIDNYNILIANIFKTKFKLDIKINEEKFNEIIKNIQVEIPEAIKEYSYEIEDDELIITNGKKGQKIISEELKILILENIKEQFNGHKKYINIPTKESEPKEIDIEEIYEKIYKEAKDAYVVEEPFELHKEENGIDFAISIEEAKMIVNEKKETYSIPLNITEPKVKIKDLGDKLFKQTLAKYTTIYDAGNKNRSHNIALAAQTINGTILMPGETFSYNGILGNTNKEKGYKLGTAYVGGKVVESYGGGICQVSSTLYNSVLYANLEIVERYNHSYIVNYVPAGRDATVSYGGKDFKFKNTRNYPIKIVSSAKNGVVSISIMGIKEEKEYEVVLTSTVISRTPRNVVYENNSEMAEGTQKVIQSGYDGKKSIAYKTLKYNGQTISKTVLSKDTYKPMNKIVQVGTKKVAKPVTAPTTQETEKNESNTNI